LGSTLLKAMLQSVNWTDVRAACSLDAVNRTRARVRNEMASLTKVKCVSASVLWVVLCVHVRFPLIFLFCLFVKMYA
jgi:hypothetical protein